MQNKIPIPDLLKLRKYDPAQQPPPDQVCIAIESKNIASMGNFIVISGLPKRGKGKFMAAIAAAALTGNMIWGIHARLPEGKREIGFFDTDQSRYDFYGNVTLINQLAGLQSAPDHFHAYNVRRDEPGTIIGMLNEFLKQNTQCGMLLLDNIGDLLNNFNDEGQSKTLINYLKRITDEKNICIVATLHLGKSNNTTIGHLGAMADRYAQTILECDKVENTYQLKLKMGRNCADLTPIPIYYDEYNREWKATEFIPQADEKVKPLKRRPRELNIEEHQRTVLRIFNSQEVQQYQQLINEMKELYGAGENWCKECFRYLLDEGMIFKIEGGYTNNNKPRLFIEK